MEIEPIAGLESGSCCVKDSPEPKMPWFCGTKMPWAEDSKDRKPETVGPKQREPWTGLGQKRLTCIK